MEVNAQAYLKFLLGVSLGCLFIWIGVTGRLGSLLGAMLTPGNMTEGLPSNGASGNFGVNSSAQNIVPSSGKLTDVQIAQYAVTAGLATYISIATAVAVAIAESQGNVQAHNPGNGTTDIEDSYGLWQINILAHRQYTGTQMYDPSQNAAAMVAISSNGVNWGAWGTFTSGAYQQYMGRGNTAAQQVFAGI
jgi:Lysozyme like domain